MSSTVFNFERMGGVESKQYRDQMLQRESSQTVSYFLFRIPLAILFLMSFSRTEYSAETNDKKGHFLVRTRSIANRRAKTEAARAELCKRRLFPPNKKKENETSTLAQPRTRFPKKKIATTSKKTGGEIVRMG